MTDRLQMDDDPSDVSLLELKGDALHESVDECGSVSSQLPYNNGSRFSRSSPLSRTSLSSRQPSAGRRRGRSDAPMQSGASSPAESALSISMTSPTRSQRSVSTAAPSVDPRGDQEVLMVMLDGLGDSCDWTVVDLSLAAKKTKKTLKSIRSITDVTTGESLTDLNVANNAIASLDGVDVFTSLTALTVSRNHLKRIDSPLFALVNLTTLDLSGNFISHIPRGIVSLAVLEVLSLAGNNLTALKEVDVLGKLANLHVCSFAGNPFCKLPTYKDYVVSKLASLDRLDDSTVTDNARDKSRRRFSEDMFSKDKCLREADLAHASEQNKLRDMQLALEAENLRLKDELQLKSKLLQNKSKAWSSATEQLIQLQQELAMMNLDRRNSTSTLAGDDDLPDGGSNQPREVQAATVTRPTPTLPSPTRKVLVDSACSPFFRPESEALRAAPMIDPIQGMMSPLESAPRHDIPPEDHDDHRHRHTLRIPTFEDDHACPAYDDPDIVASPTKRISSPPKSPSKRASSPPKTMAPPSLRQSELASPLLTPSSRAQRRWEQQHRQLVSQTTRLPMKSPREQRSQVIGLVDTDNLVRQIQALQSCKQSLVSEIAKEEQLLHELKRESAGYAGQIERLDSDLEVLLCAGRTGTNRGGPSANKQREEETLRAKLDVLRSKLHYAEDKEAEIETTIVRLTKRVLENDMRPPTDYGDNNAVSGGLGNGGPFDKEIFALTNKLQNVIVEKEDIHAEMSRLMNQLRSCDGTSVSRTGLSPEALLLIDQQEQVQRVSVENQDVFIEKQKKCDEFKRKLRDVHDRIKVKEEMIASLVTELKDVESELEHINEMTPKPPTMHRRALSLDSHTGSLSDLGDPMELGALAAPEDDSGKLLNKKSSPRKQNGSPVKATQQPAHSRKSISNMVEAAAADMNEQFEQKFKELFSPEVLEAIKQDIYRKLSQFLPASAIPPQSKILLTEQQDLHRAISEALETHMKQAMSSYEKKQQDENSAVHSHQSAAVVPPISSSPKKGDQNAVQAQHDRECWDEVDDFSPVEDARYVSRFRYVPDKPVGSQSPISSARSAALQRIHKACERLHQAEAECKVDSVSMIEVDVNGKKKSSLKVVLMGARDLPTTHLRTKNLDPYVAMEVVYPEYLLPPSKSQVFTLGRVPPVDAEQSQFQSQSVRSRTVKKSLYPVWDEEFDFSPIQSLKGYLHVRVLNDRKLSREQLVGEAKIPLRLLVHQRKIVESFVLRTTPGRGMTLTESQVQSNGTRKSLGGLSTIRLQLQLSFSKIEKAKRLVDELVSKYEHEHNVLPPLIERVEEYEVRLAQDPKDDQSTGDSSDHTNSGPEIDAKEELPTYETWKAQQPEVSDDSSCVESDRAVQDSASEASSQPQSSGLSSARLASLWSTPTSQSTAMLSTKKEPRVVSTAYAEEPPATIRKHATVRSTKPTPSTTGSSNSRTMPSRSSTTSAKAAMAQLRQLVKSVTPATTSLPNAGAGFSMLHNSSSSGSRRKTLGAPAPAPASSTASISPECFDDYSPYHPDFQLLDPLGIESMAATNTYGMLSTHSKLRSSSLTGAFSTTKGHTDLRIFKSPGFTRREPSGGFPERFIGLDNQTSERMKRMFGRIDNSTPNNN